MRQKFLLSLFSILIFIGLASASSAFALSYCPTASPVGVSCISGSFYCNASCQSGGTMTGFCPSNSLSVVAPCAGLDACGACSSCQTNYLLCTGNAYPNRSCTYNDPANHCLSLTNSNCTAGSCASCVGGYNFCSSAHTCTANACTSYQTWNQTTCTCVGSQPILQLGNSSVAKADVGTAVLQSGSPSFYIPISGYVGIGVTNPLTTFDIFSANNSSIFASNKVIGNVALPSANSDAATKGYVDSSFTSISSFWGGSLGSTIWNLNTGNVGIGTTNPTVKLHVAGDIFANGGSLITDNGVTNYGGSYYTAADSRFNVYNGASSVERLRITQAGNVGIGTTNPGTKLDVATGDIHISPGYKFSIGDESTSNTGGGHFTYSNTSNLITIDGIKQGVAIANIALTPMGGKVGIGNTDPLATLDITSPNNSSIFASNKIISNVALPSANSDAATKGYVDSNISSNFLWSGTKDGKIWNGTAGAGNVGIGTTNPFQKLQLAGQAFFTPTTDSYDPGGAQGAGLRIGFNSTGDFAYIQANNTGVATKNLSLQPANGNVGIGVTNPANKLQIGPNPLGWSGLDMLVSNNYGGLVAINNNSDSSYIYSNQRLDLLSMGSGISILSDGSVGIGNTSPLTNLDIISSNNSSIFAGDKIISNVGMPSANSDAATKGYVDSNINFGSLWSGTKDGVIWNGTEGVGNVGIGTTNPNGVFEVAAGAQSSPGEQPMQTAQANPPMYLGPGDINAGYSFIVNTNGQITALWANVHNTDDHTVRLYDEATGQVLASTVIHGAIDTWVSGSISPVNVTAGNAYIVAVRTISDVNGNPIGISPMTDITINRGMLNYGTDAVPIYDSGALVPGAADITFKPVSLGETPVQTAGTNPPVYQGDGDYNMGYSFTPNADGKITTLWLNVHNSGSHTVRLYDEATAQVIASKVISGVPDTWTSGTITPVSVTAGHGYVVAVRTDTQYSSTGIPYPGMVVGNITINGGKLDYMTDNMPMGDAGSTMYGSTDITFKLNGSSGGSSDGASALLVDNSGNVGIGITNPAAKLDVSGDVNISGLLLSNNIYVNNLFPNSGSGAISLQGNVGIGITNPGTTLEISSPNNSSIFAGGKIISNVGLPQDNSDAATKGYVDSNISYGSLWGGTKDGSIWNGTLGAGNVGIGTTNPGAKLNIDTGNIRISRAAGSSGTFGQFEWYQTTGNPGLVASIEAYRAPSNWRKSSIIFNTSDDTNLVERLRINYDGSVGIGNTNPLTTLDIVSANNSSIFAGNKIISNVGLPSANADAATKGYVDSAITIATSSISTISKYVGMSANPYLGNNAGTGGNVTGYTKANNICNTDQPGSHVCTSFEVLMSINAGITMPSENVWIFYGPPGYTASANDCEGRTTAAYGSLGAYWEKPTASYPQGRGLLGHCDAGGVGVKFACCK